jgi:GntR family transcriptional regulator
MTTRHAYRAIAADLRERVALGEFDATGALDSEAALSERYAVSRPTVRKALEVLRGQGLVAPRHGAGWFVAASTFHQTLALGAFRHAASAVAVAGDVERDVVEFGFRPAPPALAQSLGVAAGADVLYVRSRRTVAGDSLDLTHEWVPAPAAHELSRHNATEPGIWAALTRAGHTIAGVRQTVTAGTATAQDAATLGVDEGMPVLLIRRLAIGADDTPVALADHRYLAHRFALEIEFASGPGTPSDEPPGLHPVQGELT